MVEQHVKNEGNAGAGRREESHEREFVNVIVYSPRTPAPKHFKWQKTMRVGEAAKEAAAEFGYQAGNPGLQTTGEPPHVLDNNRTLAEEHVENGTKLELIDTGGGVAI